MIKVDKKEYKTKPIDLDLRFEVLTRVTKDGERVMPNTLLWIVRNTVDIADSELNDMSALDISLLGNQVVVTLMEGKKK